MRLNFDPFQVQSHLLQTSGYDILAQEQAEIAIAAVVLILCSIKWLPWPPNLSLPEWPKSMRECQLYQNGCGIPSWRLAITNRSLNCLKGTLGIFKIISGSQLLCEIQKLEALGSPMADITLPVWFRGSPFKGHGTTLLNQLRCQALISRYDISSL